MSALLSTIGRNIGPYHLTWNTLSDLASCIVFHVYVDCVTLQVMVNCRQLPCIHPSREVDFFSSIVLISLVCLMLCGLKTLHNITRVCCLVSTVVMQHSA